MKHVLSTKQFFDRELLSKLFFDAKTLQDQDARREVPQLLAGKVLATLFYEPSTRTRFSFESAMLKLGGQVITTENAKDFSSAIKGETIEDTIRVVNGYADAIVLRHPENGAAAQAAGVSGVPILNAGDGSGEHPTQALLDLYTIQQELGRVDGLTVAMVGDLRYGRTIHSLSYLLAAFEDVRIIFVSPDDLKLPAECLSFLKERNSSFSEVDDLEQALAQADVLYVTRIQKERFERQELYDAIKDSYRIDRASMGKMKEQSVVMHPLPRVSEISTEVDDDPRAAYFRQARNGLYIRMALLKMLLAG